MQCQLIENSDSMFKQAQRIRCDSDFPLFDALYKQCLKEASESLYIEVRGKRAEESDMSFRRSYRSMKGLLKDMEDWDDDLNYWFGVALRHNPNGGTKKDCALLTALFVDIDYGQKGHKKINRWKTQQEALDAIRNFPLKPSILVHSGYGYQAYWVLKEPVDLRNGDFEKVESIHQGLAQALGGDSGTQDVSRILRIPETYNVKIPDDPKLVAVRWWEPNLVYDLKDFEQYRFPQVQLKELPPSSKPEKIEDAEYIRSLNIQGWVKTLILSGAEDGYTSRNERDHAVIRELVRAKVDLPSIVSIFQNHPIGMDPVLGKFGEKGEYGIKYLEESYQKFFKETDSEKTTPAIFTPGRVSDLEREVFQEPRWAVDGLLLEGLSILAGPPKVGKSFLSFGICLSIATGRTALGQIEVERGDVLYLGLEDSKRRINSRVKALLPPNMPFPENLFYKLDFPRLDQGGYDALDNWLSSKSNCRLVVIDTIGRVRPMSKRRGAYEEDVDFLAPLQGLALKHRVAILGTHHTRKLIAEDFVDAVSGTLGVAGTADTVMVLNRERGKDEGLLRVTGRDIEENAFAMKFQPTNGAWEILGEGNEYLLNSQKREIINLLKEKGALSPKDIAEALGKTSDTEYNTLKQYVWKMGKKGELKSANGKYDVP
jgi:hypothetical protein